MTLTENCISFNAVIKKNFQIYQAMYWSYNLDTQDVASSHQNLLTVPVGKKYPKFIQ